MNVIKDGRYKISKKELTPEMFQKFQRLFSYYSPKLEYPKTSFSVEDGYFCFPRNTQKLSKVIPKYTIEDNTCMPPANTPIKLAKTFALKQNQQKAMEEVLNTLKTSPDTSVILKAEPGFGKSYTLPYVVDKLNTNVLIIVDRTNLVKQMEGEFLGNCESVDLAILSGKNKTPSTVNITTFQFLIRNLDLISSLRDYFGLIVIDECHVIGSDVFTLVASMFNARYRLGLSATPTRSDFMTPLLLDVMGTNMVSGAGENTLTVQILNVWNDEYFFLTFAEPYKNEFSRFMCQPKILEKVFTIIDHFHRLDRKGLIYTTEVYTQELYAEFLKASGKRVGVVNQKTKEADRLEIFQQMERDELDIIISGSILQKGISIKRLDFILNLSNLTKEAYEQLIGRLRRHHDTKKEPIFVDMLFCGKLLNKGAERMTFSKRLASQFNDKVFKLQYVNFIEKLSKTR